MARILSQFVVRLPNPSEGFFTFTEIQMGNATKVEAILPEMGDIFGRLNFCPVAQFWLPGDEIAVISQNSKTGANITAKSGETVILLSSSSRSVEGGVIKRPSKLTEVVDSKDFTAVKTIVEEEVKPTSMGDVGRG